MAWHGAFLSQKPPTKRPSLAEYWLHLQKLVFVFQSSSQVPLFWQAKFLLLVVYIHRLGRYTRKRKDNFYLSNFLHFDIAREMNIPPKFLTMENLLCLEKVRKQGWILQFYDSVLYFTSDELGLGYCWVSESACWLTSKPSSLPVNQQVTLSIFQSVSLSVWARKSVRWSVLSIHTNLQYHVIT